MFIEVEDDLKDLQTPANRRKARETTLQALYALELSGNTVNTVTREFLGDADKNNPVVAFTRKLIANTFSHREEFDEYIRVHSQNWKFDRIAILDRIIMRMAICEFIDFDDIPPKVSIDEAIELSKLYSTDKSSGFINGILDAIYDDLKKQEKINKIGRGCLDTSDFAK